jgi:transporter family-2 protein
VSWLQYVLAIAAGAANPVQAGANAQLRKSLEAPLYTAVIVYLSGLAGVLVIQLLLREALPSASRFASVSWWAWSGGLVSIASTIAGLTLAHRMGSGIFTGLSVTASLVISTALDHFGLIGFKEHPASMPRLIGCGLMIAGLWLVARF